MSLFLILPALVPTFFALLAAGIAGTVLWHKRKQALARTASMERLAASLDLSFSPTDSFGMVKQLQGFELFKRERSRWIAKGSITNVMSKMIGETAVYLFDYSYTVQAGNSRKRITQTVFFANDKKWFLPNFHLKPENWWLKLKAKFGLGADINFEENPEFSEKFWLKGELEDLVRQQFTSKLQGFLCEKPPAQLEGNNYYLIGYKPRLQMDVHEAKSFFENCCETVQLLQENGQVELLDLAESNKEALKIITPEMKLKD